MVIDGNTFSVASKLKWIEHYNRLLDREAVATAWMSNPKVTPEQREAEFLRYKCEVLDPIGNYFRFFASIGIKAEPFRKVVYPNGEPTQTPY
jgi:hypothetical protein